MATGEEFRKLSYPSILRSEINLSAGKILSFRDISEMISLENRLFFWNRLSRWNRFDPLCRLVGES